MTEFETSVFAGFEKSIHDARLTRTAMIGELLGSALAEVWFSARRQADCLTVAIAAKRSTLNGRMTARQQANGQNRVATPH